MQEMMWRRYWKSWLELRLAVWSDYQADVGQLRGELRGYQAKRLKGIEEGHSGVEIMDYFARELCVDGYLHNHARMWFAGWWIHTEKLPWQLGADFFYRHLLDADPAATHGGPLASHAGKENPRANVTQVKIVGAKKCQIMPEDH